MKMWFPYAEGPGKSESIVHVDPAAPTNRLRLDVYRQLMSKLASSTQAKVVKVHLLLDPAANRVLLPECEVVERLDPPKILGRDFLNKVLIPHATRLTLDLGAASLEMLKTISKRLHKSVGLLL